MTGVAKRTGSRFGRVFAYSSMSPLRAIGAAAVGFFAIQKVKDFFGSAISEARESQKVSALTAQVIKTTGGAAGVSAKQVGDLAGKISLLTGIDDEAIQGAENLLLTFKNLSNEAGRGNDVFNQATKIVTDMSVALDQDLKSSSIQVGKALNDPIKGITALSRVGVSFTEKQKDQIKALVESGDTLKAQKIILGELRSEFGGAAAAAATSGDKFKTAFANLQEAVGLKLLPLWDKVLDKGTVLIGWLIQNVPPAFAAVKAAILPVAQVIGDFVSQHLEAFRTALAALGGSAITSIISLLGGGLVAALGALLSALASPVVVIGALVGAAIYAYTRFERFREVVGQVVAWLKSDFIPGFLAVVVGIRAFVASVWPIVQEFTAGLIERIKPLLPRIAAVFQQIWSTIKDAFELIAKVVKGAVAILMWEWQHFGEAILGYIGSTFSNIVTVVSGVLNVLQGVIRLVLSLIKGDWSGAWDALKQIVEGVWQIIKGLVSQAINQVKTVLSIGWTVIKAAAGAAWDGIKKIPGLALAAAVALVRVQVNVVKSVVTGAWNAIKGATSAAWGAIKSVVSTQIGAMKSVIGGIADLVGKVRGWFGDMLQAIKDKLSDAVDRVKAFPGEAARALGDLGSKLYSYGRNLIQGFINGIKDKAGEIVGAVTGPISSAIRGVGSLLEIGSPSKLFHQIGEWTMEGFANGIDEAGPKVLKAMQDALDKTLDKVTAFRDGVASRLDSVRSSFASLKDSIASTFAGDLFNVSAIASSLTDTTFTAAQTVGQAFTNGLLDTKGQLQDLLAAFKKLKRWGLPAGFLSQLFASGNGALILEMASGTRAQAQSASSLFGDVQSLSNQLGGQVARNQYGEQINRLDAKLARIDRHTARLEHLAKDIGREINGAVARGQKKGAVA